MSVTVIFSNHNNGQSTIVVPYQYGDYIIKALHITCVVHARRHGENYVKILESDRELHSQQNKLEF